MAQISLREAEEVETLKTTLKCVQIRAAKGQLTERWFTSSQPERQRAQVVVATLLHLLRARFSRVRILSLRISQNNIFTFKGHTPLQRNLLRGHLVPSSLRKVLNDLTENPFFYRDANWVGRGGEWDPRPHSRFLKFPVGKNSPHSLPARGSPQDRGIPAPYYIKF